MSAAATGVPYAAQGKSDHPSNLPEMEGVRSPAQVFALVIGATLTVRGSWASSTTRASRPGTAPPRDAVLGILDVNGWHNLFHIASGAIGLLVAGSYGGSRAYALGLGALYLLWRCSASWPATATRSST